MNFEALKIPANLPAAESVETKHRARPKVIYTPEVFCTQRRGGISRYFVELIREMIEGGQQPDVIVGLHNNDYVSSLPRRGVRGVYISRLGRFRTPLNRRLGEWAMRRQPQAIVHQTYFTPYFYPGAHKLVLTVYDLIEEIMPEQSGLPHLASWFIANKKACCERADHLIAISESTKQDLVRLLGLDPAKITVTHLANSFSTDHAGPRPEEARGLYLLHVGGRVGYKNFSRLLAAYGGSDALRNGYRLICFGGGPFSEAEHREIADLGLAGKVEQRGGDDALLARYYQWATAFVYPSTYEGFGLPILEAMGLGCPVFCAREGGSTREVGGDAAVYFDAHNVEDMRQTLETTLGDEGRLRELSARGREQEKRFSWKRCYQETLRVYESLALPTP